MPMSKFSNACFMLDIIYCHLNNPITINLNHSNLFRSVGMNFLSTEMFLIFNLPENEERWQGRSASGRYLLRSYSFLANFAVYFVL